MSSIFYEVQQCYVEEKMESKPKGALARYKIVLSELNKKGVNGRIYPVTHKGYTVNEALEYVDAQIGLKMLYMFDGHLRQDQQEGSRIAMLPKKVFVEGDKIKGIVDIPNTTAGHAAVAIWDAGGAIPCSSVAIGDTNYEKLESVEGEVFQPGWKYIRWDVVWRPSYSGCSATEKIEDTDLEQIVKSFYIENLENIGGIDMTVEGTVKNENEETVNDVTNEEQSVENAEKEPENVSNDAEVSNDTQPEDKQEEGEANTDEKNEDSETDKKEDGEENKVEDKQVVAEENKDAEKEEAITANQKREMLQDGVKKYVSRGWLMDYDDANVYIGVYENDKYVIKMMSYSAMDGEYKIDSSNSTIMTMVFAPADSVSAESSDENSAEINESEKNDTNLVINDEQIRQITESIIAALPTGEKVESEDVVALKARIEELENENITLKTQIKVSEVIESTTVVKLSKEMFESCESVEAVETKLEDIKKITSVIAKNNGFVASELKMEDVEKGIEQTEKKSKVVKPDYILGAERLMNGR